ncbi:MAG: class I SAM-dependent rRNA methyltransferase [Acidobacteriota bacterium]|nr:class I SAM-dependent rRNA methyltransferase [Blastocatellia bacterium]MDW8238191.1 class I SAM-dependent rRNA methyltransferase [Acidobacteriota bacterium]
MIISRKGAARLRAGHPWVFSGDLVKVTDAVNGDIVAILDERDRRLGWGFYSQHSLIALRWIAGAHERINDRFWARRFDAADSWRRTVVENTEAYRLVFGESDMLPSLIIDRYGDHYVIQTLTPGMERLKSFWIDLLIERKRPRAIIERNDVKVRQLEELPLQSGVLWGTLMEEVVVQINGISFAVDLIAGQKTGAFLDQRENQAAVRKYARGYCLDCFCYDGGFSMTVASQCQSVQAVDIAGEALQRVKKNALLNRLDNIECVEANVFDLLRDYYDQSKRFDIIILDPPAFAKTRAALGSAIRGYKEINRQAMRLLHPGGILVTCSCSYHLSEQMFLEVLLSAAFDAGRCLTLLEKRTQARDHPILLSMPESYYLKCFILRVN